MSETECLFCKIAHRTFPADIIAETEGLLALKDINPQAPTHVLIITVEHIPTLADITDAHTTMLGRAIHFANRLARQYQLDRPGYRLVINCGQGAGQSVFHLHLHLLGGRTFAWPPG